MSTVPEQFVDETTSLKIADSEERTELEDSAGHRRCRRHRERLEDSPGERYHHACFSPRERYQHHADRLEDSPGHRRHHADRLENSPGHRRRRRHLTALMGDP